MADNGELTRRFGETGDICTRFRPRRASELIGSRVIKSLLVKSLNMGDTRPKAYLLCGTSGCGKTTSARIAAMGLNCEKAGDTSEPCLECPSCQAALNNTALHILELNVARLNKKEDAEEIVATMNCRAMTGRNKVYILDECFHYDAGVSCWENGKVVRKKIGDIVHNKRRVDVVSVDDNGNVVIKPVTQWFKNKKKKVRRYFFTSGTKTFSLPCTDNHLLFRPDGKEVVVGELLVGERVRVVKSLVNSVARLNASNYKRIEFVIGSDAEQVILGTLLGDASISVPVLEKGTIRGECQPRIGIIHSPKQQSYFDQKVRIFGEIMGSHGLEKSGGFTDTIFRGKTLSRKEFMPYWESLCRNGNKFVTREYLNKLKPLGLALWYMDDGSCGHHKYTTKNGEVRYAKTSTVSMATHGFTFAENVTMAEYFREEWGIIFTVEEDKRGKGFFLATKTTNDAQKFLGIVAPYVIPEFQYKLGGRYESGNLLRSVQPISKKEDCYFGIDVEEAEYIGFEEDEKLNKRGHVYDLEVQDTHRYVVNGIVVHNCHMLTTAAQNLLLKNLEEPPPNTYVFLCTTDPQKLLPTVRQRCEPWSFSAPTLEDITDILNCVWNDEATAGKELPQITKEEAEQFKQAVLGRSFREVLKTLDTFIRGGIDSIAFIDDEDKAMNNIAFTICGWGEWHGKDVDTRLRAITLALLQMEADNGNVAKQIEDIRRGMLGFFKKMITNNAKGIDSKGKAKAFNSQTARDMLCRSSYFTNPMYDESAAVNQFLIACFNCMVEMGGK